MSVSKEDLFCLRLPLLDVREQESEAPSLFRQFDLYMTRGQAEYLIFLAKEALHEALFAAPQPERETAPASVGIPGGTHARLDCL